MYKLFIQLILIFTTILIFYQCSPLFQTSNFLISPFFTLIYQEQFSQQLYSLIFDIGNQSIIFFQTKLMSIKKINGYKIMMDSPLGHGAYGTVYKGEQNQTELECAIKIVDKRIICKDPYLKSALDSEIQIMSKLSSPNVVGFFDVLMSSHNYYIVQELCDGDLQRFLQQNKDHKVPQQKAVEFLTQLCNGFIALVKEGIVHRDLKPANILIKKGVLKIADFGFAKVNVHKKVKNQSCVGTPLYMSIEVLKSMGYTSKCDIWSLGCIFYEMLHGCTPWTAKSQYDLVVNVQNKPLQINPNLSENTKKFLTSALKVCEQQRICWDDVYKHPIFNGYFDKYISENMELENKYKKVMSDLRFRVNSQNIDMQSLWSSLGFSQNSNINFAQFQHFLEIINPNMMKSEQVYFFQKLDSEGKGSICLIQFSKELQKHHISTNSNHKKKVPLGIKKMNSLNSTNQNYESILSNQNQPKWDQQFEKRVKSCFLKLHKIITSKSLTLYKTFMIYDKDNSGELTIDQFSKILKKLDPVFTSAQIQSVFDLIDSDMSKSIKFQELNNYYCKVNGIPLGIQQKENLV